MLKVRVIKKFHDAKGILIGYRIQDTEGQERDVYKEQLKSAVASGQCEVVNMTLTSDGRLIGSAKKAPTYKGTGRIAQTVFTNGRKIACVLVNEQQSLKMHGVNPVQIKGLDLGLTFDCGMDATTLIGNNHYDNIRKVDGKVDFSKTRKSAYTKLKDKLIKTLELNGVKPLLKVEKGNEKYEYFVIIENYHEFEDIRPLVSIVMILIENCMYDAKLKPAYIDEGTMSVQCMTGIADVRKALKTLKF